MLNHTLLNYFSNGADLRYTAVLIKIESGTGLDYPASL
jgi:hypothetical protein